MQSARNPKTLLLPDIDWVEIPAGEFIYGEAENQQAVSLERFHIARYPVTYVLLQVFIDNGGYDDERRWQYLRKLEPQKSRWPQVNRPRTDIDLHESVAFCRWLSVQLDFEIKLPTEQQWDKAACGTEGLEYPWGDVYQAGFANVDEKENSGDYLAQTTAVGVFPQAASPYGFEDMAGNVWEWCLNKYDQPEDVTVNNSNEWRVLRGGSWIASPGVARATLRGRDDSYYCCRLYGFRLCCSLPFTDH